MKLLCSLLTLVCCLAAETSAQSGLFSLTGIVLDQNDAVVAKARVVVRGANQQQRSTSTDASGAFRFEGLAAGDYEIEVSREGFKSITERFSIGARQPTPLRILLPVAEMQQEIAVSETPAQVNTEAGGNFDANTADRQMLNNLPSLDQDYVSTMSRFLSAGATGTGGVTLIVDGMEMTKAGVSASAIQEVKINNNPYSAEYSRPGRGRVEVVTKPGSAQYHGAFNWLFRNAHLNARDPFAITRPPEQRRIYEGNLTGPLSKNRQHPISFLITANREEEDLQSVVFARTPQGDVRQIFPNPARNTEFSARFTRQMSDKTTFSAFYSYQDRIVKNQGVGGVNLPEVATNFEFRENIVRFNHSTIVSPKLVNQINLLLGRYEAPTESARRAQRIVVQDAFSGGGAQADSLRTEEHWVFYENLIWTEGKHVVKAGIQVPDFSHRGVNDRTNELGAFYFSSLADYQRNLPFTFIQQQGKTAVRFWEIVLGAFAQDEIRVRPNLSVVVGLRYDWQNYFGDHNNLAPRFSFAYAPDQSRKTVIRGGFGLFYDRTGPGPISEILRFDGERLRRYVITNPCFPNPLCNGQTLTAQPASVVRLAPEVIIPYTAQFGGGVERQLLKGLTLTVNYIGARGFDLFRSRDVNAPLPPLFAGRPDFRFAQLRQIESTGRLTSHSLEIGLRGAITTYFNGMIQYVYGRAWNDTGGIAAFPANSYDLTGEQGRSDFDMRHRFNLLGTVKAGKYFSLGMALTLNTGAPYTLTTGRDDNKDGQPLDRPAGVGRNTLEGPGFAQFDLRWSRDFYLVKGKKDKGPTVTTGLDAFNVFNRVNDAGFIGNLSSPFFGRAVSARPSRRLQLSFRFTF
jgi:hypothetical protein